MTNTELESQALQEKYALHEEAVVAIEPQIVEARLSPCGQYLAGAGYDARVRMWSLIGKEPSELNAITGHNGWVHSVLFHPQKPLIFSADSWGQIRATRIEHDVPLTSWMRTDAHDGWIRQIDLSPDAQLLASCAPDKRVCLWASESGQAIAQLHGHDEDIHSLRFSPDGKLLATGDAKGKVRVWDTFTNKLIQTLDASELWLLHRLQDVGGVRVIRFNQDSSLVACAGVKPANGGTVQGEPTVVIFDLASGKKQSTLKLGEQKDCLVHDLYWTSDDVLMGVTCGTPGTGKIVFHRLGDEKPFFETTKYPNCQSLSYHSASKRLAVMTTNRNSNGNGRRLNKSGEYEGNNSPVHLFRVGQLT